MPSGEVAAKTSTPGYAIQALCLCSLKRHGPLGSPCRRAGTTAIRAFVKAVRAANATAANPLVADELETWSSWARAQADRIDPVVSGAFKTRPAEAPE